MAEDKNIKIKIDVEGNALDKTEELSGSIKGVKSEAKSSVETFGLMDTGLGKMAKGVIAFGKKGVNAMRTFKGAVISTGIGALVIAVISLISYFNKTEEGANKLKVIMAVLGTITDKVVDVFVSMGKGIAKLFSSTENFKEGLKNLGKVILENIINRFKAFAVIGKAIVKILKGDFKEGFKELGQGAVQAATGVVNLGDKLKAAGDKAKAMIEEIKRAAEVAAELQRRENQLAIDKRNNLVTEANLNRDLAKIKSEMNDLSKTDEERIAMITKAMNLQNKISDEQIRLKREEYTIQKERNKLASSTAEDKEKEKQLEADLINLEAERSLAQKLFITKKSSLELQAAKEKKKLEDDEVARAASVAEELAAINEEAYLTSLETDQERRDAKLKSEEDQFQEDLKIRRDQKEITEEEFLALEEASQEKYAAIRNKYREEDAIANKKALAEEETAAKAAAKAKIEADNAVAISKLRNVTTTLSAFSDAVGEETKLGKAAAITAVLTDAAQAIIGTWAGYSSMGIAGTILAVLQTATIGITTAKSISNINSAALGGWVGGASHQNGGVTMNMEGGEYIVNKRAMQNPSIAESVMAMNAAGNGNNTGSSKILNETDVALIAASVVQAIPVQVVENDITEKQRKVQVREESYSR